MARTFIPAYSTESTARRHDYHEEAPALEVHSGRGASADADASSLVLGFAKVLAVFLCAFIAIGAVRVGITCATVRCLEHNVSLQSQIEEGRELNSDLEVDRSTLSSSSRIVGIATESYGMVYATHLDDISSSEEPVRGESGEAAAVATEG